jgi:hypothetical protein
MRRKTILTLSALAVAVVAGAVTIPAIAGGGSGHWGPGFGMMGGHHGPGMMMGQGGPGMMMKRGGHGPMGMMNMTSNPVFKSFDADANGTVTAEEAKNGAGTLHAKFDADKNGSLSDIEFQSLFSEVTKSFSARPFSMLDADGNKEISAEEMAFPAQMMARMQAWHGAGASAEPEQQ